MFNMFSRPQAAVATVPAVAATAGETSSDTILIERVAAGDKLAMQALFARHRTSIYRWLLRVSNETLAEDLLSEVFLDVWRQAGRFEGRSSVSTWLISIARFKALSARRPSDRSRVGRENRDNCRRPRERSRSCLARKEPWRLAAPGIDPSVAGTSRNHRPCLLPRQVGR
jgi:RNA polymerase sigma-70 factor (ECF subfamily)